MKKKRLILSLLFTGFITPILFTQVALAATGEWIDTAHISYEGSIYTDKIMGDKRNYRKDNQQSGCIAGEIDYKSDTSGHLTLKEKDALNGDCNPTFDEDIGLTSPENARVWFYRVDEKTFRPAWIEYEPQYAGGGGGKNIKAATYEFNADRGEFIEKNSGDCHSSIKLNGPSETAMEGQFFPRINDGGCKEFNEFFVRMRPVSEAPGGGSVGGGGGDEVDTEPSCESEGGEMSWLLCPVLRLASNAIGALDEEINNLLIVKETYYNNKGLYQTWGQLRNLALLILVPMVLVMVIGTALGFEFVSAYTVKKALPRLFIAILFITLSWPLTQFFVGFINTIGQGIAGVLGSAFGKPIDDITLASLFQANQGESFGIALIGIFATGVALSLVSIGIILSYAFVALIGLFVGFLLLATRQFLVIALMLFAPLAILAWIFPGNDKLWKLWRESFTKLLLLYPLVIVLVSAGRIFAQVVNDAGPQEADSYAAIFIKLIAYIGPYFFIPAAFKFAGGVFANVAGMANDKSRGLFDRQKKYRGAKMGENWQKTKNYQRFSDKGRVRSKLNTVLGAGASPKDIYGSALGRGAIAAGRTTGRMNQGAEIFKSDPTMAAHQNDDNFLIAIANQKLAQQKLEEATRKRDAAVASGNTKDEDKYNAEIRARQNGMDNAARVKSRNTSSTRLAALNQLASSGYQFSTGKEGYDELFNTVNDITGGDAQARAEAMNTAQYNLKNAMRFDLGGINNGAGFDLKAGYDKAGLYQLSNAKTQSIEAWGADVMAASGPPDHRAAVHYRELKAMLPGTTGANRDEVIKQMNALEARGIEAYGNTASGRIDPKTGRQAVVEIRQRQKFDATLAQADAAYDASFSVAEKRQGYKDLPPVIRPETVMEAAEREARTYERPDPNREQP